MPKVSELIRSLEGFRYLAGSTSTAMKAANPKPSSDAGGSSYGSFANLKIIAEKLVKEQASVKTDLEMAHTKLRRATEQINLLEGKLQQGVNENAKLMVKQNEDSKLWQGLDSKISSTKTLSDQLTETLQQLASQTEQAEEDKKFFEELLGKNSKALDEFNSLLHDLSTKLECAQQKIISGKQEMLQIKQEKQEIDRSYKEQLCSNDATIKEQDSLIKQLEGSVDENKPRFIRLDSRLQCMEQNLKLKDDVCISLKENLARSESEKNNLEPRNQLRKTEEIVMVQHVEECQVAEDKIRRLESEAEISASNINRLEKLASELQGRIQKLLEDSTLAENHKQELLEKISKLESDNQELQGQVQSIIEEKSNNAESLQGEITKRDQQVDTLENQINQLRCVLNEKEQLYCCSLEREKTLEDQKLQAEKLVRDMESRCSDKISENKQDSERYLMRPKEEHGAMVARIHQDHELKESTLRDYHKEELQRIQSQAENELREHTKLRRATEQTNLLEGKLEQAVIEKAKFKEMLQIKQEKQEIDRSYKEQLCSNDATIKEQDSLIKQLEGSVDENKPRFIRLDSRLQCMEQNLKLKDDVCISLKENLASSESEKSQMAKNEKAIHSKAYQDNSKRKEEPAKERYPGNTATVVLDPNDLEASLRSYKRAIRKARAWCRANTSIIDMSEHFGPGAETYTTPAKGTFHLTFELKKRKLTLFIYGPDLYVKGWHGDKYGSFQIQKNFMPDPACPFLDTGENYHDLCPKGDVANVRIGPQALFDSFEALYKCNGIITTDLERSIAMFAVGTSEAIRLQDVFEEYAKTFDTSGKVTFMCTVGKALSFWINRYGFYSGEYLKYLISILRGESPAEIMNRDDRKVTSVQELRQRIRVPLRGSERRRDTKQKRKVKDEDHETPKWSPPHPDGKDWSEYEEAQLDNDEIRYWPSEDMKLEDKEFQSEDRQNPEKKIVDDFRLQKARVPSSISRFSTAVAYRGMGCIGKYGIGSGGIDMVGHHRPITIALGRIEGSGCFLWRPRRFSGWRGLQTGARFLKRLL
ncbi:hypothetical protein HU200_027453 [Digitaria exilis]|uniref:Uncharacterized protein n=1 Tax=Digitaria exilis TaxID=1010633 RepID=A0A835ETH5_9POAL|nr:hypothetical protein HU200_027453 [Digitaria exilis]